MSGTLSAGMKKDNPNWGAPRLHGELLLLGFNISEPTVSRYLRQLKRMPDETKASQWLAFLQTSPSRSHSRIRLLHRSESLVPCPSPASSSSNMVGGALLHFQRLPSIQQAIGLCNNSGKHSRSRVLIVTLCSTMMPGFRK